jgi:AbrB family looped-hinge helix DNA binding protein
MATATMTSKGQLTIPKDIRDRLGLKPGDKVELVPSGDGAFLRKRREVSIRELFGILPKDAVPATPEAIDEAIGAQIVTEDRRSRR